MEDAKGKGEHKEENLEEEVMDEENTEEEAMDEENTEEEGADEENIEEEMMNEENTEEEVKDEEDKKEVVKNEEKEKSSPKEKVTKSRKRSRKKTKDEDKPESSGKKGKMKVEGMGMIFMCSSKTKKDCYRYKVLGLPASKRDTVLKIYKGMRLFLFDFDLKLLYGIYKAAGPGGYNLEPEAFNSAYPSQVRFTVLKDCLPLAEEKFKRVIKDNYYSKNKFDCQLTSEQVKNLCKLFLPPSKGSKSKQLGRSHREGGRREVREGGRTFVDRVRTKQRGREEERHRALRPVAYEREAFASPVARLPLHRPLPPQPDPAVPPPSYGYRRTLEPDVYGRDPLLEHHDRQLLDFELRRRDEIEYHDPYVLYREPPSYRDPLYSAGMRPEYHPPEYRRPLGPPLDYLPPAGQLPKHRLYPPLYRY